MLNFISEISEIQLAEEMLWLYDRAMAATSTGIVIADATKPNRPLIYCNPAFEQMTGYSRDEVIGQNCRFLQGSDTDRAAVEQIRHALRNESECRVVLKNYRKDGSLFWNELTISPVRDSKGQLTHFIGVQNDITERVKAETELQEKTRELARSEQAFRKQSDILQSILDNLADGVIVADENSQFLLFNPAAKQILGQGLINVPPKEWTEQYACYLPDEVTPHPSEDLPLARAIRGEEVNGAEVFIRPINDLEGIYVSVNARPIKDETENLKGGVAVFRNITERKRSEKVLRESEAQLREQARQLKEALHGLQQTQSQLIQSEKMSSLGQLIAGIAHEINNPVSFIYGNISHAREYLQDLLSLLLLYQNKFPNPGLEIEEEAEAINLDYVIEDMPKLLSSMKEGAERIRNIVLSLRNFSRLDEAEIKSVDIHEGIDSTLLILQHRLKAKPQHPEIEIIKDYAELPKIECNAGELNQVFMNILNNAIDAIEESFALGQKSWQKDKGQIRLRTELTDGNRVRIRICDNGIGMSEEVRQHLYEPFFTTKPVGKGTGLGLSISYQIVVEKHRGQLQYLSTLGKGTESIVEIPLHRQPLQSPELPVTVQREKRQPMPAGK